MSLVDLLVVLNHLPYDIKLSFISYDHVADVKYILIICLKVQDSLCSAISLYDQPFSIY